MLEPLYQVSVKCLNCEKPFHTSKVRPSFKQPYKKDTDFCSYYKSINPEYYIARVCPSCGFSTTENFSEAAMTAKHKQSFHEKIGANWSMKDYGGERTAAEAMQTYKLALICGQIKEEKPRVIAGILHHIAWLYREQGDAEQEKKFLEFALDAYIKVYENEQADVSNAVLMYMMGELSRRLKKYPEAIKWFSRVINDKRIIDAAMIKASREQWAATREDMLADQVELPDEMVEKQA